jgi:DNA polymerase delta subunit 2
MNAGDFVTGVCLAVRGVEEEGGYFRVNSVCFPGPGPQKDPTSSSSTATGLGGCNKSSQKEDKFVALVSGLNLGEEKQDCLPVQLLVDYVTGLMGDPLANRITRMVVAGNLSREVTEVPMHDKSNKKAASEGVNTLKESDLFLTQVASSMPVDLMPGPSDPCNVSLPQQPFHRCLLPSTTCYENLGRVTNPHRFSVDEVSFLGTSGQNVDDVMKYVEHEDRLGAIASTLEWCHSTPTAPDTVPCFPFQDKDPFLVKDCPHVCFVGNQPKLETGILHGPQGQRVRVIALPKFAETPTCVLVNLKDLSCHPITFSAKSLEVLE